MNDSIQTIQAYIDRLTMELKGCDPALIMDAVNDAGEYLHNEVETIQEGAPSISIQSAVEQAVKKFGSPAEVALSF
ncbi:MAG: hypothetical protein ABIK28_05390, partial [Planctomycetota bacterium]